MPGTGAALLCHRIDHRAPSGAGRCRPAGRPGRGRGDGAEPGQAGGDRLPSTLSRPHGCCLPSVITSHHAGGLQSPRVQRGDGLCSPGQLGGRPWHFEEDAEGSVGPCNASERRPARQRCSLTLGQGGQGGLRALSPSSLSHNERPGGAPSRAPGRLCSRSLGPAGGSATRAFALVLSPPERQRQRGGG